MNRRNMIFSALALAGVAVAGRGSAQAAPAAPTGDLPADGVSEVKGKGWGGGGRGWGPPGHARGWGRGNSGWAATRGRKRGWYKHRRGGW